MKKCIDITGRKFGKLTVIKRVENKGIKVMWLCRCECGRECVAWQGNLSQGQKSCGCMKGDNLRRHNLSKTRLYDIWCNMKSRCFNLHSQRYSKYGGENKVMCEEWKNDFQAFYDWAMANGYADNLTIDRKDNSKGYSPDNCRWATQKEQQNNRRNNHLITYNGKTQTIAQWAVELNVPYNFLRNRIYKGWSIERAFTTPKTR